MPICPKGRTALPQKHKQQLILSTNSLIFTTSVRLTAANSNFHPGVNSRQKTSPPLQQTETMEGKRVKSLSLQAVILSWLQVPAVAIYKIGKCHKAKQCI